MSIHYLLDGYNVIHRMPSALRQKTLEEQRRTLIDFIERHRPQGSLNNSVTVVFDGNEDIFGGMASKTVKVLFSLGESADDKIKKIVARSKNPKDIIVVTDDRDIQYAVRALRARVSATQSFLNKAKGRQQRSVEAGKNPRRRKTADSGETAKYISKTEEGKINSEFGKIWLGSKKKREKKN